MIYTKAHIDTIAYELAPVVVSSEELEEALAPLYRKLHIPVGQLEALTGIQERRWWPEGYALSDGAIAAGRKALAHSAVQPADIGAVVYCGVGRDNFEPATACRVAGELGIGGNVAVYDLSNACLGVLNGILDVANRIELGQIRAGLVVSAETARDIVHETIEKMLANPTMPYYIESLATLTGGSGAVALLVTDGSFRAPGDQRQLLGGVALAAPEHHGLCTWGLERVDGPLRKQFMSTDAVSVLKHGVALGLQTWEAFLAELNWTRETVAKTICHQVGSANQQAILKSIGMPPEKDFTTFGYLGNMGTVSLPITAAIAGERGFLKAGERVALLGIGSGLNCMMLGVRW
ncbi:MAG: 3-oxoacyl-ACP synthase III [Candidatus Hydrogenedentes bacterium]|nr:3-oxoacyl-ACP synthase III [Candidatus Hydrogenedentota bacterium]